jgi:hypothetical protein
MSNFVSVSKQRAIHLSKRKLSQWLLSLANWTHVLTVTMSRGEYGYPISDVEVEKRCRLFLSRINRRIYGRHGTRRKGYRIASVAYQGAGAYGDHPHVHWAFQKPPDLSHAAFLELLCQMASSTKGIGKQFDVQYYFGEGWLGYMIDHGNEGWMHSLTSTAVCPQH